MNTSDITTMITTVGFPIVMCLCMAWYVKYTTDTNRADMEKERQLHDSEMTKVTEAINNNTLALQKLADKLGT